jgi:hypothetical protein
MNHFNIILKPTTRSPNLSRSFEVSDWNFVYISYLFHARYVSLPVIFIDFIVQIIFSEEKKL